MDFITIVWMLCCYLAWPLIEILITGERTVRHVDNVMSIVFLFAMAWSYTVGKVRAERKQEEREKEKKANILQLMDSKKPNTNSNPTDSNK